MRTAFLFGWALSLVFAAQGHAQCDVDWLPGDGYPGVVGVVEVLHEWDPDGAGPATPLLIVGGEIGLAGDQVARNLAAWDPSTGAWQEFGGGIDGPVYAVTTLPSGKLLVAGAFAQAGTTSAANVAIWNGTFWSPLGAGTNGPIRSVLAQATGDIVVGGVFTLAGGMPAVRIANWDGTTWSPVGGGCDGSVLALAADTNGDLLAGGEFVIAGAVTVNHLARWNGATWSSVGGGVAGSSSTFVGALLPLPGGDLFVGGCFATVQGQAIPSIAQWDGTAWSAVGTGLSDDVHSLSQLSNGDVLAAGAFQSSGAIPMPGVARWDGAAWSSLGAGIELGCDAATSLSTGDVIAGGSFGEAGGVPAFRVARWDGSSWSRMADGFNGSLAAIATTPSGEIVVGGRFSIAGDVVTDNIAMFDGQSWSTLGNGVGGPAVFLSPFVSALAVLPNGDIVAGGDFTEASGLPVGSVAQWDGAAWSSMAGGADGPINTLMVLPSGDLIAGGSFGLVGGSPANSIARWDGLNWSPLGTGMSGGLFGSSVSDVAELGNGDLVAVGRFAASGGVTTNGVARWDGSAWHAYGAGLQLAIPFVGLAAVEAMPNGDVVVGGLFSLPGSTGLTNVARWTGSAWVDIGNTGTTPAQTLHALPNGDLLGAFGVVDNGSGTGAPFHLSRWDGTAWLAFGQDPNTGLSAIESAPDGTLLLAGPFTTGGGLVSASFARIQTTCAATVAPAGAGCPSSGGNNDLQAVGLPWAGTTFVAEASGLPALALVANVIGFAPSNLPLAAIFAEGQVGCSLLTTPDVLDFVPAIAGSTTTSIALPNSVAIAGTQLFHQLIPFEITPAIQFVAITATNALELTVGFL